MKLVIYYFILQVLYMWVRYFRDRHSLRLSKIVINNDPLPCYLFLLILFLSQCLERSEYLSYVCFSSYSASEALSISTSSSIKITCGVRPFWSVVECLSFWWQGSCHVQKSLPESSSYNASRTALEIMWMPTRLVGRAWLRCCAVESKRLGFEYRSHLYSKVPCPICTLATMDLLCSIK